jgi:parallel beta-helix repeat protein
MPTLWLSPTDFVTGDQSLRIAHPSVQHPGTVVTCTSPGDLKWLSLGLPLPPAVRIDGVTVHYRVSNPQSFISQVRLTAMEGPDQALVLHDDPTDLASTTPVAYTSVVGGVANAGAVTLALRLNFQSTAHEIMLGAVAVGFTPMCGMCVVDACSFGAKADGSDARPAIQAAIDFAAAQGGGVVCLAAGRYELRAALVLPSAIELRGAGAAATILRLAANVQTDIIVNSDPTGGNVGIAVTNLQLDGNKAQNPRKAANPGAPTLAGTWDQAGVKWRRVSDSRVSDCHVHDCAWNGIVLGGCRRNAIVDCRSDDNGNVTVGPQGWGQFEAFGILLWEEGGANVGNRVVGCICNGNEKHGIEVLGPSHRDNLILACLACTNNSYGIVVNGVGGTHAATIMGCTCLENAEGGIGVFADRVIVEGNFVARNCHGRFRGFSGPPPNVSAGALNVWLSNFCTVANNIVLDSVPAVAGHSFAGIGVFGRHTRVIGNEVARTQNQGLIFGGEGVTVVGNTVLGAGTEDGTVGIGIQGNEAIGATIEANVVRGSRSSGILLNGPGGQSRVRGNAVSGSGQSGIEIQSQHDCVVEGNTCTDNGAGASSNAGRAGIAITATSAQTVVSSNRCGNPPQGGSQDIGIITTASSDRSLITGNIVTGNNLQGLSIAGTANVVTANLQ